MSEYNGGAMNSNSLVYSNACNSTRWLTEEVFSLIDLVQRNEAIYNPRHKYYFCRPYVENFWREVDNKLEKNPGASLAKWTNLRISFRREYTNYLEEKVPPCWTYFDRMFFLHPYLRKKHQQIRPLDGQIQDALAQFSSISSRLKGRDNTMISDSTSNESSFHGQLRKGVGASLTNGSPLETYLEYLDEVEPTPSELDDMTGYEEASNEPTVSNNERCRYSSTSVLVNDIKSECDDNMDEFVSVNHSADVLADDDPEPSEEEHLLSTLGLNNIEKRQLQQQQRLHHIQRLHTRALYEDFCVKRLRQQETIGGNGTLLLGNQNLSSSSLPINSVITSCSNSNNISLVRPTLAKPVDSVNISVPMSATNNNLAMNVSGAFTSHNSNSSNNNPVTNVIMTNSQPMDYSNMMNTVVNSRMATTSSHYHHNHHPMMNNNRYEVSLVAPSNCTSLNPNTVASTTNSSPELCDCKTDPDAMFLMSLIPDIQKLNGRDRGKIKIAFQNILQDFLYPD